MKQQDRKSKGQLTQAEAAASCGVSVSAFARWGVEPVARSGRNTYYTARAILENRLRHRLKSSPEIKQLTIISPAAADAALVELIRERMP